MAGHVHDVLLHDVLPALLWGALSHTDVRGRPCMHPRVTCARASWGVGPPGSPSFGKIHERLSALISLLPRSFSDGHSLLQRHVETRRLLVLYLRLLRVVSGRLLPRCWLRRSFFWLSSRCGFFNHRRVVRFFSSSYSSSSSRLGGEPFGIRASAVSSFCWPTSSDLTSCSAFVPDRRTFPRMLVAARQRHRVIPCLEKRVFRCVMPRAIAINSEGPSHAWRVAARQRHGVTDEETGTDTRTERFTCSPLEASFMLGVSSDARWPGEGWPSCHGTWWA